MTSTQFLGDAVQRLLAAALLHPSRFSSSRTGRDGQGANRVLLIRDRYALSSRHDPEVQLAEHLADAVVARTGRGLELDTVWDLVPVLRAIGTATRAHGRRQYDAVVVLIHNSPTRARSADAVTVPCVLHVRTQSVASSALLLARDFDLTAVEIEVGRGVPS